MTLEINTLGDTDSRNKYRKALISFLEKYKNDLSEDSLKRLEKNPLRILDSKDKKDQEIVKDAPQLAQYLTSDSQRFFDHVLEGITALNIPFKLNSYLVRGLDYYGHTAFEFKASNLGAQSTVLAGVVMTGCQSKWEGRHCHLLDGLRVLSVW